MATTAAGDYVKDHGTSKPALAEAAVHSYATVYWWAAGLFAVGFVIAIFLYRTGRPLAAAPAPAGAQANGATEGAAAVTPQDRPTAELLYHRGARGPAAGERAGTGAR